MVSQSKLRFGKELDKLMIADIQLLIDNKIDESQNIDYKQPSNNLHKDSDNLAEVISSFLNTDGGILVYGVTEDKDGEHRYPSEIKWSNATKETFENLLVSRIHPWSEKIKIHRIENKDINAQGIFVIEVPKSANPPHMHNHIYYQRLNYQSKPMEHENVFRAFQASWIRRRDIVDNVIEPLYSEIKEIIEGLYDYRVASPSKYSGVISHRRFLYDQIEPPLKNKIDELYRRSYDLTFILHMQAYKIANKILNTELSNWFEQHKEHIRENIDGHFLRIKLKLRDISGSIQTEENSSEATALFQRKTLEEYLASSYPGKEVIGRNYFLRIKNEDTDVSEQDFQKIWKKAEYWALRNRALISMWKEISELQKLGKDIIESFSTQ